ncbi:MAG: heat-inducible transcription repressor HrcA [Dehalococcoidia bacterium]|nr:MAG: heat-inducible transcription repressor HrcA [Dehalococcoidia bacterium]
MLFPRTETILKSIVGQYIVRAAPVPSQSIINDYELRVSPATIRNEMARLEQEGYITRCHPSAGSIPSDKGYRYYVESLSDIELPLAEQRLIRHLFHQVEKELEEWLRLAAKLIAQLVQNMAIVTMPKPANCQFKHLKLIALQDSLTLIVLVLRGAKVKQQLIAFDQVISQPKLTATANKLNAAYSDLTSSQILAKGIRLSSTEQQLTDCLLKIMQAEDEQEHEEPYLDGLHFMLNQPEFAHNQRVLPLMELVDHRNLLRIIAPQRLTSHGVRVVIGKENKAEVIQDYSVVISRYGLPEEAVGTIGVIGPTRMPYARAISTVNYLSSVLSGLVAELYGKETPLYNTN